MGIARFIALNPLIKKREKVSPFEGLGAKSI